MRQKWEIIEIFRKSAFENNKNTNLAFFWWKLCNKVIRKRIFVHHLHFLRLKLPLKKLFLKIMHKPRFFIY